MQKKQNIFAAWVISFFLVAIAVFLVLYNTGTILNKRFDQCVYLQSSKTVFNEDNTITVSFKNTSNQKFEDRVIHLTYEGPISSVSNSEQKIISFKANGETVATFTNPGWTYTTYNEIIAWEQDAENTSAWLKLSTGRNFVKMGAPINLIIAPTIVLLVLVDVMLIVKIKRNNGEDDTLNKSKEGK